MLVTHYDSVKYETFETMFKLVIYGKIITYVEAFNSCDTAFRRKHPH